MPIVKTEFDAYIIRYYSGAHMEADPHMSGDADSIKMIAPFPTM
jgi:hypothetical protein